MSDPSDSNADGDVDTDGVSRVDPDPDADDTGRSAADAGSDTDDAAGGESPIGATDPDDADDAVRGDDAVGDGGEPADPVGTVSGSETRPADERKTDSKLRAIGVAFGLGILGIVGLVAVSALVGGAVFVIAGVTGQQPPLTLSFVVPFALSQIVGFLGVGLAYLRWRGFDRDEIVEYLGIRRPSAVEFVIALVGPIAVLITALAVASVVLLFGTEPAQNQGAAATLENPSIIPIMIVAMLLVVGPCEEFLFRGVIQSRARETFSAVPAIVLAAAVFAPAHVVSLAGGVTAMLATISILFVPSLLFGAVYEYTENLVVVAVMHGVYNSLLLTIGYISITYGPELEEAAGAGATILPLVGV